MRNVFKIISYGGLLGRNSSMGGIRNFCYPNESRRSPLLKYAIPLDVSGECLLDRWAYPSNNDLLRLAIINEGVFESLQSYYELAHGNDLSARGASFTSKTSLGITRQNVCLWND